MGEFAIKVQGVTKRYRAYNKPSDRLRELLSLTDKKYHREFTALDDLSFEIPAGQVTGVMGRNGAGKSTLLKCLAGIVEPTSGTVEVHGKIASIIELGAGFHPEFTGSENIYINAAILGFTRYEVDRFYDKIVKFAELGSYINMPVKTYSSGMFVRLAFSIAINVQPDVLLIDEALAVGDAVFAHRCLGKIQELKGAGVTIFLVSHDPNAVNVLCDEVFLMGKGKITARGNPKTIIGTYNTQIAEIIASGATENDKQVVFHEIGAPETGETIDEYRFGTFEIKIETLRILNEKGKKFLKIPSHGTAIFEFKVVFKRDIENPVFGIMIKNRLGIEVYGTNTYLKSINTGSFKKGDEIMVRFRQKLLLGEGTYTLSAAAHTIDGRFFDYRNDAVVFEIIGPVEGIGIANLESEFETIERL